MLCTVQAMEAVATVVGVDASKLSLAPKMGAGQHAYRYRYRFRCS